jgi:hypothetical protein
MTAGCNIPSLRRACFRAVGRKTVRCSVWSSFSYVMQKSTGWSTDVIGSV